MLNIKKLAVVATEIYSNEIKSSGSIPAPNSVHSIARIFKWPSFKILLADTHVNHTGDLAVGNYLGFSLAVGIFTFVVNSLYGFNYVKINL